MKWIKSRKIYESSELEMSVSDILQPLKDEDLDLKTKFTSDGKIFISILKVRLDYDFVIEHLNHVISFLESEDYSLNDVIIDYVSGVGELNRLSNPTDVKNFGMKIKQDPGIKVYSIFLNFL